MRKIVLLCLLGIWGIGSSVFGLALRGTCLFSRMTDGKIEVLMKADDSVLALYSLVIDKKTVHANKEYISDITSTEIYREYINRKMISASELDGFGPIMSDIKIEMLKLRDHLKSSTSSEEPWVNSRLLRIEKIRGYIFFVIRFEDADRYYGGILYSTSGPGAPFQKIDLTPNLELPVLSVQILSLTQALVFLEGDQETVVEVVYIGKRTPEGTEDK